MQLHQELTRLIRDPLYRNSAFLTATIIARSVLGLLFWIIVTQLFTESEVGLGSATISAILLVGALATLGWDFATIRFLPKAKNPVNLINVFLTLTGIATLVIAIIFILGTPIWSPALGFIRIDAVISVAFLLFCIGFTLSRALDSIYVARRKAEYVFYRVAIMLALRLPFPVLFVIINHDFGIVASWGTAIIIAFFISLFAFSKKVQPDYIPRLTLNTGILKNTWNYAFGSYFTSLFISAPHLVLPILTVNRVGATQNAYFFMAWSVAALLFAIPTAVSRSLFAEGVNLETELLSLTRRSIKLVALLLIPGVLITLLASKYILLIFGTSYSENGVILLQILALSALPLGLNKIYESILRTCDRIRELAIIWGFITFSTLVGSYIVLPLTGIIGIGYVWLLANAAVCLYIVFTLILKRNRFLPFK